MQAGLVKLVKTKLNNGVNFDVAFALKRDGTWFNAAILATTNSWGETGGNKVVYEGATVQSANNSGSSQSFTEACIVGETDVAQVITELNTDQTTVTDLVGPIKNILGSPVAVADGQTLRFTSITVG